MVDSPWTMDYERWFMGQYPIVTKVLFWQLEFSTFLAFLHDTVF